MTDPDTNPGGACCSCEADFYPYQRAWMRRTMRPLACRLDPSTTHISWKLESASAGRPNRGSIHLMVFSWAQSRKRGSILWGHHRCPSSTVRARGRGI